MLNLNVFTITLVSSHDTGRGTLKLRLIKSG